MQIFTQPSIASQRGDSPFGITGDSCLRGGNHAGARNRHQDQDPKEQVSISDQIGIAVETATKLAEQNGGPVTVEVGGVKVTITPKQANAPTSIAQIDEPKQELQVRPEIRAFLDELKEGTVTGVKHTTRGIQEMKPFVPESPKPFGAGRFQVDFDTAGGEGRAFIVQTEAKVGHLAPVTPGETNIGGHISLLSDPADSRSETIQLTRDEQEAMLESLYAKTGQRMTKSTADATNFAISSVAAVRYSGEGASAVSAKHHSLI